MPRKSPRKSQSSKVKVAASGDATIGGDVVGRDKIQIIQNLVDVAQFLTFAQVQGLLPQSSVQADYKSIDEAFEKNISARMNTDLQQATAFAGEILKSVLHRWSQPKIPKPLPFKYILKRIPPEICKQLRERGYWRTYALLDARRGEFLPLKSLSELWIRQKGTTRGTNWTFGIWKPTGSPCRNARWRREGYTTGKLHELRSQDWDIPTTTSDDFRLLMAGLVIDLIRLESTASGDVAYWNALIDRLATRRTSAEKSEPPKD